MRPCVSVSGTRWTRWAPRSNFSRAKTPRPAISAMISLKPPSRAFAGREQLHASSRALRRISDTCGTDRRRTAPPRRRRCRREFRGWRLFRPPRRAAAAPGASCCLEPREPFSRACGSSSSASAAHVGIGGGVGEQRSRSAISLGQRAIGADRRGDGIEFGKFARQREKVAGSTPSARRWPISSWRRRMRSSFSRRQHEQMFQRAEGQGRVNAREASLQRHAALSRQNAASSCRIEIGHRRALDHRHQESARRARDRWPRSAALTGPIAEGDIERPRKPMAGQRHRIQRLAAHFAAQRHRRPVPRRRRRRSISGRAGLGGDRVSKRPDTRLLSRSAANRYCDQVVGADGEKIGRARRFHRAARAATALPP